MLRLRSRFSEVPGMKKETVNTPMSEVNVSLVKKQCRNSLQIMPNQKCVIFVTLKHVWTEPHALQSRAVTYKQKMYVHVCGR
jgi:hypothetical protein